MAANIKRKVLTYAREGLNDKIAGLLEQHNLHWSDCRYPTGDTPLHAAARDGNVDAVEFLLTISFGDQNLVDIPSAAGKTALHEAAQNSQPDVVSYLLKKGADCRSLKQADWTPLMLACTRVGERALTCCKLLMQVGGLDALRDRNKDGWSALHIAAREGDPSIVASLLQQYPVQASVKSKNGRTPLHTAALHGHTEVMKQLLECGYADYNAQDSCGSSPLHDAVRSGSIDTVKVLVEAGADMGVCNSVGHGLLHMAAEAGQHEMLTFLCANYESKIKPQHRISTPLHCAVRSGQVKCVKILLQLGANPLSQDAWGHSCLDLATVSNSEEITQLLKRAG